MPSLPIVDHIKTGAEALEQARHINAMRRISKQSEDYKREQAVKAKNIANQLENYGIK